MSGMIGLTLRTARAHLTRSLLSSLAVVLGVAFVCGSLMFTDGLEKATIGQAAARLTNVDVRVGAESGSMSRDEADAMTGENSLVERVRRVDGVRAAEATWSVHFVGLAAGDGRKISGSHEAMNISPDPALQPFPAVRGRMPAARGEVLLDQRFAERARLRLGDSLLVSSFSGTGVKYTLVGLADVAVTTVGTSGGMVVMTTADIAAMDGNPPSDVIVDAEAGLPAEELAARISAAVGVPATAHDELVRRAMNAAVGDADIFRNALLGFGALAVGMAAFVIANTFTIVLAQRSKETALLRLVGATRRQVFRSVVLEAAVIGLGGSVLGLAAGLLLAYGLPAVLSAAGITDQVSPVLTVRTVLVALAVGIGVTTVSALLPARRGTRVLPVEALTDAAVRVASGSGRARRVAGVIVTAAGLGSLGGGTAAASLELSMAGTLLTVTGFLVLSPIVVPGLVRVIRRPLAALGGATVSLALLNAVRNPRRFATTTNALVVGVTLVGTFTLVAHSAEAPAERRADEKMFAAFLVVSDLGVLPDEVVDAMDQQPALVTHPSYQAFDRTSELDVHSGEVRPGTAIVTADAGVAPGGEITIGVRRFTVASVAPGTRMALLAPEDFRAAMDSEVVNEVQVDPAAGVSKADARRALDAVMAAFPTAGVYDQHEYAEHLNAQLNQGMDVVTALLALAVVIALIGVANTLTLSVVERTRENALLRAVGLTRRRLRGTLATEAVIMALTGTLIGVAASVVIALSLLGSIRTQGEGTSLAMPWDRLGVLLGVAVLAALVASIAPARRAIRLPVAESLAAEG